MTVNETRTLSRVSSVLPLDILLEKLEDLSINYSLVNEHKLLIFEDGFKNLITYNIDNGTMSGTCSKGFYALLNKAMNSSFYDYLLALDDSATVFLENIEEMMGAIVAHTPQEKRNGVEIVIKATVRNVKRFQDVINSEVSRT